MAETIRKTLLSIKKRPALLIFTAVMTLLFCILEQFNPFTRAHGSWDGIFGADFFALGNELAEKAGLLLRSPALLCLLLAMALLFLIAVSAILGITYAGYFHQFLQQSEEKEKLPGEIRTGISRHPFRLAVYFLVLIPCTVVFALLLVYSLFPAILSVKLFLTGTTSILFPMILICILTVLADFFAILFYTMYATFAIPSLVCFRKGSFGASCRMVNAYCWYLLPRTCLFLVLNIGLRLVLLLIHYGLGSVVGSIAVLLVVWVVRTAIDFFYLNFTFNTFSAMKSDMYGSEG